MVNTPHSMGRINIYVGVTCQPVRETNAADQPDRGGWIGDQIIEFTGKVLPFVGICRLSQVLPAHLPTLKKVTQALPLGRWPEDCFKTTSYSGIPFLEQRLTSPHMHRQVDKTRCHGCQPKLISQADAHK
jgi:hypothetical protein